MNHSTLHAPVTLSASSDAAGGGASRPTPARLRRSASPLHHVAHVERAPVRRLLGQLLDQLSSQELSHVTHRPSGPCCWPRRFSSRSSQPRRHHRLPPHTSPATGTWPWRVRSRLSQASAMPKRARNSAASLCWEGWLASQLSPWRARSQVAPLVDFAEDASSCGGDGSAVLVTLGGVATYGLWGWSIYDAGAAARGTNDRLSKRANSSSLSVGLGRRPTASGHDARVLNVGLRLKVR